MAEFWVDPERLASVTPQFEANCPRSGTAAGLRSQDDHNATGITDAGQVEA